MNTHTALRPLRWGLAMVRSLALAGALTALAGCHPSPTAMTTPEPIDGGMTLLDQAEAHVRSGEREQALAAFTRAIEINPKLVSARMGRGDLLRTGGDYASAQKDYQAAAEQDPKSFDAQYYNGLMLHMLNRLSEAVAAYLRALTIKPDDPQANLNLATAYYQLSEYASALPYAQRAVKLNPNDGPSRFTLGAIYAGLGQHADAVTEYQQATERMDLTPQLLLKLADSLGKLERWAEMRNALTQLVRTSPSAAAYERLGFAQFRLQFYDDAKSAFQSALTMDPSYFPALNGLGVCELNTYVWSEKTDLAARDRAIDALRHSLRINRDQPRIEDLLTRYQ